jgi:HEAT repeat protein
MAGTNEDPKQGKNELTRAEQEHELAIIVAEITLLDGVLNNEPHALRAYFNRDEELKKWLTPLDQAESANPPQKLIFIDLDAIPIGGPQNIHYNRIYHKVNALFNQLTKLPSDLVIPALIEMLGKGTALYRTEKQLQNYKTMDLAHIQSISALISDDNDGIRGAVLQLLNRFVKPNDGALQPLRVALEIERRDEYCDLILQAISQRMATSDPQDFEALLLQALAYPNARKQAAKLLGEQGSIKAITPLSELLGQEPPGIKDNSDLRDALVIALSQIDSSEIRKILINLLEKQRVLFQDIEDILKENYGTTIKGTLLGTKKELNEMLVSLCQLVCHPEIRSIWLKGLAEEIWDFPKITHENQPSAAKHAFFNQKLNDSEPAREILAQILQKQGYYANIANLLEITGPKRDVPLLIEFLQAEHSFTRILRSALRTNVYRTRKP